MSVIIPKAPKKEAVAAAEEPVTMDEPIVAETEVASGTSDESDTAE